MMNVDYSSTTVPAKYKCITCKATNCKLWRNYGSFTIDLECLDCAIKSQSKPDIAPGFAKIAATVTFSEDGTYTDEYGSASSEIGWRVPAIPDEEGCGYWGHSSAPPAGRNWWKKLPLRGVAPKKRKLTDLFKSKR